MRLNRNLATVRESGNASTCGFFPRKGRCARGLRNLPHTSANRFRKCGEIPRSADQAPVSRFRDLRFCCQKSSCARRFLYFTRTSENRTSCQRYAVPKSAIPVEKSSRNWRPILAGPSFASSILHSAGKPMASRRRSSPMLSSDDKYPLAHLTSFALNALNSSSRRRYRRAITAEKTSTLPHA